MLPYSNLSTSEKSNLLDLIFDETQTVPSVQSKFNESFPAARYPAVCLHLSSQCKEFISSLEGAALVSSLAIVDSMRRADCRAAKTLFYDILIDLDRAIRKDICFSEQINYSTKESKESKKSAAAILSDGHRIHTAAKVCAFELLTSHPAPAEKIASIVAKKQSEIDSKLDAFSSQQSESSNEEKGLKLLGERGAGPALSEMMKCWEDEYEKRYTGDSWGVSAVFNPLPSNRSALTVHTATVKIPSLPVTTGELRYLLPIPSSFLLFDDQEHSVEWMQAHTLLNKARSTVLSKDDQNTLKKVITAEILQHIGVNESLLSDLANQSLEICAVVLQNLPSATSGAFIQSLLKSNAPSENIDQIFVLAANALKQINVRTLIYDRIQELKDSSDKEKLLSFSTCLHHLMTKDAQENKEIYIADPVKKNLEQLFQASTIPEVASRWEEIKKVSFA